MPEGTATKKVNVDSNTSLSVKHSGSLESKPTTQRAVKEIVKHTIQMPAVVQSEIEPVRGLNVVFSTAKEPRR
jgi:hypothetical protein